MRIKLSHGPKDRLVPPPSFGLVEKGLYRGGEPNLLSFPFLKELGLKTVVWLAVEDPNEAFVNWADESDINFEHLGLLTIGANAWDTLTDNTILKALEIIMNRDNYPIFICCSMGRHRTGTVIGCLRKIQGWSLASIIDEYQRFALRGERTSVELTIESFGLEMEAEKPPEWFRI